MPALLQLDQLRAGYGRMEALHGISLTLHAGQRLALVGRNGVGKSTTLKATMGLCTTLGGTVSFDGRDITRLRPGERARLGLGYVAQTRDVFPSLSVEENLICGLKSRPRRELDEAYAIFPRLAERRHNGGGQLSGGEQQMLAVARTLLGRPRVLLLDEPLEGLAPIICQELMAAFEQMATRTGVAVLLVEQRIEDALAFAPDVLVLDHGEVVYEGRSDTLRNDPAILERHVGIAAAA